MSVGEEARRREVSAAAPLDMAVVSANELEGELMRFCAIGNRFVGTAGEHQARKYLLKRFSEAGLTRVRSEPVAVLGYERGSGTCEVMEAGPAFRAIGLQCTSDGTVTARALYLGAPESRDELAESLKVAPEVSGCIAVLSSYYPYLFADLIVAAGAVGLVVISDAPDGLIGNYVAQFYPSPPAPRFSGRPLPIPGVTVSLNDGHRLLALLSRGSGPVRITHRATYTPVSTANVVGEVEGETDAAVVVGAHFDTQLDSHGYCDNGTGISALLRIAERWRKRTPLRRIEFCAFAAEEFGLAGSMEYCRAHAPDLPLITAMVNLDALGWHKSAKRALYADPSIRDVAWQVAEAIGWKPEDEVEASLLPGSDHNPFIDSGVPACWFWRFPPGHPYYHTAGDNLRMLDFEVVAETATVAAHMVERMACDPSISPGGSRPSKRWWTSAPDPRRGR